MPSDAAIALYNTIEAAGVGQWVKVVTTAGTDIAGEVLRYEPNFVAIAQTVRILNDGNRATEIVVPLDRIVSVHFTGIGEESYPSGQ